MRASCIIILFILSACNLFAQTFRAVVKDKESKEPLPGATAVVAGSSIGGSADGSGVIQLKLIPSGPQVIKFSFVGYQEQELSFVFPLSDSSTAEIYLSPSHEELDEVVISSTRSSRTIDDIPTRVEFIAGEELDEKANMKPGDIRMLLSESTGIQTQQTSATTANASIRIQGLDGRYTQILKDGFPLYSGFAGGLGLLQTPPLDLKQAEVIKGSTSTLYGGGAIAGLVNLISKTPKEQQELKFVINGTSAKGLDVSGFYGQKFGKVGLTFLGSRNSSEPYDPAKIGLTAIPKFERYTVNPKIFFDFTENTKLNIGLNYTTEDRIGGDMQYIKGHGDAIHRYFEDNRSNRFSTQISFSHRLNESSSVNLKNSINRFNRSIDIPDYGFDGSQTSSFSELNISTVKETNEFIFGANIWTDKFSESQITTSPIRNYQQTTLGAFAQNNKKFSEELSLETGLRADYVIDYGLAILPRLSLLYKPSTSFTTRIGGGFGYKAPTIFTEETERLQFQNVLPISPSINKLERSYGANWDLNYRLEVGEVGISFNNLFFYTYLNNPLMLKANGTGSYELNNISGFIDTKGTETNVKVEMGDFKLFVGYTFTDTKIHQDNSVVQNPLTAKHRLNNVLMYELEEKWKIGLEAYYFSTQRLNDNSIGKDYWICGFMAERLWEKFSLFVNFENFLDTRQTRFDTIYTGSISNPVFRDIYAPVDGFVINGGLKLKF